MIAPVKRNSQLNIPFFLMGMYLSLWLASGSTKEIFRYIPSIFTYGIAIAFSFLVLMKIFKKSIFIKLVLPILVLLAYSILLMYFGSSNMSYYLRSFFYLFVITNLYIYFFTMSNDKERKLFVIILIIDMLIIALNTFIQLEINPSAVRLASTGGEEYFALISNIDLRFLGTYVYFYGIVSVIIASIYLSIFSKKNRLFPVLLVVILFVLQIKASYSISILIIIIMFVFIILLSVFSGKLTIEKVIILTTLPLITLIFFHYASGIFNFISNISYLSSDISLRAKEISSFFSGENVSDTEFFYRISLAIDGFRVFFKSFGLGNNVVHTQVILHQHSTIPDLFGEMGIFAFAYIILIVNYQKSIHSFLAETTKQFSYIWLGSFLLLSMVNPTLLGGVLLYWIVFTPIIIKVFSIRSQNIKERND